MTHTTEPFGRLARLAMMLSICMLAPVAWADELFRVNVNGSSDNLSVSGNSLLDLAENLAGQDQQFGVFAGQAFTADITYGGLDNAVVITSNDDNSIVTLQIPSTGFSRTFDAADGDLADQIEDFLKSDGSQVLADLAQVINQQTLVGVTDGNPAALTALMSAETFRLFGDFRNPFGQHPQGADGFRIYAQGSVFDADGAEGVLFEGALTTGFRFTDRVGLVFDLLGGYRNLEDSETITIAGIAGLPIRISPELDDDQPLFWQITPNAHIGGGGSADQLSGGLVVGLGATNLVGFKAGDFFFSSGQQLGMFDGQPIDAGGFEFETEVDQTIFRGSLAVTYGGIGQSAYLQGGVMYTDFLEDAALDSYVTPFAGLGLKLGRGVFRVGAAADLADDFEMYRGEAELRIAL